ncbi:MAG: GTP-binding protein [Planctomycetaceae bacterium]|nr:GTP-binding protein [Planctomycetaceae bacterium]
MKVADSLTESQFVVTRLTPSQVGALGVIGILGEKAALVLDAHFVPYGKSSIQSLAVGSIAVGDWHHAMVASQLASGTREGTVRQSHEKPECVVLVKTGMTSWEVHVHGGQAVITSLLGSFVSAGAVNISWGEWFACNGNNDRSMFVREQLAQTDGFFAAQILTRQLAGYFERDIEQVQEVLCSSRKSLEKLKAAEAVINRLECSARIGMRLAKPWHVILLGPVNAGKSSLLNALAGYARSIVSPYAGTTRDVLETRVVLYGWAVDLIDTAGFHLENNSRQPASKIEKEGIERALVAAQSADLILKVRPINEPETEWFSLEKVGESHPPCINVGTKADLPDTKQDKDNSHSKASVVTSARTGLGLDELVKVIIETLVPEMKDQADCFLGGVPITSGDRDIVRDLHQQLEIYSRDL